ncbi:MAG TPA: WbqC family protein [Flavobacteriaceae bacterium]|nr:WbqC family protein [Flavobacteriaceae bacterium]
MTKILIHPAYFGPIDQFSAMAHAEEVLFENEDNYQKQTYRNRQYVYGANGKLLLNIPVKHNSKKVGNSDHRKYKDVQIENSFHWQRDHWRSLQTAYRTSPFFEYYEDDLVSLYEKPVTYLLDFNYRCLEVISSLLSLDFNYSKTEKFSENPENCIDLRKLIIAKRQNARDQKRYQQVFADKHGFLKNLSILDLLFNEGPQATDYL